MPNILQRRPRSCSVIYQPEEVFNIPSQERQDLLSEFVQYIGKDSVSAPLWACLHACDISKLRVLVESARNGLSQAYLDMLETDTMSLPLQWVQAQSLSETSSSSSSSSSDSCTSTCSTEVPTSLPSKATTLAGERDGGKCALARTEPCEVVHIYPKGLIDSQPEPTISNAVPDFWDLLEIFFDIDHIRRWRREIFRDPFDPSIPLDGCHNRICLDHATHDSWIRGSFALRPVAVSEDNKQLTVQFYWQSKPLHSSFDKVEVLQAPDSSKGLIHGDGDMLYIHPDGNAENEYHVSSGDVFVFRTENPKTHPLPSFELLDMQWHLNRICLMSGVTDILSESQWVSCSTSSDGAPREMPGVYSWLFDTYWA